jgi:type III secretion protein R
VRRGATLGFAALGGLGLWLTPRVASAASFDELLTRPVALVVALGLVSVVPFLFMTLTAFVKISTVLQIVRGAIGAQGVPSNTVVMALAAALAILAMAPVGTRIGDRAKPLFEPGREIATADLVAQGIDAVKEPLRDFLEANSSQRERARFLEIAKAARPEPERAALSARDLPVLAPAFIVTELTEAFALGFAIYLPFLVIDLVVSNVLLALGMQMMQPAQVSLPFKLLLFVAIDGWGLLAQALVSGYRAAP